MDAQDEEFAGGGDVGETEAVHAPHRDDDPPRRGLAMPALWLGAIGLVLLSTIIFLVAWTFGMGDVG